MKQAHDIFARFALKLRVSDRRLNEQTIADSCGHGVPVLILAAGIFAVVCLWSIHADAVEIPFTQLFFGVPTPSTIEDALVYPNSYLSLQAGYWDIYHERAPDKLHDYHQNLQRMKAVWQRGRGLIGFELNRSSLNLRQENVHTDSDQMDGTGEIQGGRLLVGSSRLQGDYIAGIKTCQLVAAAGWRDEFSGEIEALVGWGRLAEIRLRAETRSSSIKIHQAVNGYRFPFYFPFRTDRFYAHFESEPIRSIRARLWGIAERSHGEGDAQKGFENRPRVDRHGAGFRLDYRLERHHRWQINPRLERQGGPFPGLRMTAFHHLGDINLNMFFNGTRYLRLDDLQTQNTMVRLDVVPVRWLTVFGGWQRTQIQHAGDSFFDIWPFVIWDVFLAKRYRLGDMDAKLDAYFIGLGTLVETGVFEIDLSGRFEFWDDAGALDLLERVDVIYPFFFEYEKTEKDVDINQRYAIQLDPSVLFRPSFSWGLRVTGRITVPFGKDAESQTEPEAAAPSTLGDPGITPTDDKTVHGGIMASIELIVGF
ncbi:MAG: hypothetical protein JSW50_05685 [Candidatus Latescibacterota bacterium]|nr:MAG: hypothetical protein JSW50_05685 [Candidatus Latescibacterota bacterium]